MEKQKVKECIKCHKILPLSEFPKSTKTINTCKKCRAIYKKQYMSIPENRARVSKVESRRVTNFIRSLKSPCIVCGESTPCCIDFHHLDPKTKEFNITLKRTKAKSTILAEVAKCVCLCSNCHRKLHSGLLDIEQYLNEEKSKGKNNA